MPQDTTHRTHTSFILRIWQTTDYQVPQWRALLTEVSTKRCHGFTDPAALAQFLAEIGNVENTSDEDDRRQQESI